MPAGWLAGWFAGRVGGQLVVVVTSTIVSYSGAELRRLAGGRAARDDDDDCKSIGPTNDRLYCMAHRGFMPSVRTQLLHGKTYQPTPAKVKVTQLP